MWFFLLLRSMEYFCCDSSFCYFFQCFFQPVFLCWLHVKKNEIFFKSQADLSPINVNLKAELYSLVRSFNNPTSSSRQAIQTMVKTNWRLIMMRYNFLSPETLITIGENWWEIQMKIYDMFMCHMTHIWIDEDIRLNDERNCWRNDFKSCACFKEISPMFKPLKEVKWDQHINCVIILQ